MVSSTAVQKQVGHKTLNATSVYLRPGEEAVAEAYSMARSEKNTDFRREVRAP